MQYEKYTKHIPLHVYHSKFQYVWLPLATWYLGAARVRPREWEAREDSILQLVITSAKLYSI